MSIVRVSIAQWVKLLTVTYIWAQDSIPAMSLSIQLPAYCMRRAVEDGPSTETPAIHAGDLEEAPIFSPAQPWLLQ